MDVVQYIRIYKLVGSNFKLADSLKKCLASCGFRVGYLPLELLLPYLCDEGVQDGCILQIVAALVVTTFIKVFGGERRRGESNGGNYTLP